MMRTVWQKRFWPLWLALAGVPLVVLGSILIAERAAQARFHRINVGMSEDEVLSILGPPESAPGPFVRLWSSPLDNGIAAILDDTGHVSRTHLGPMVRPSSFAFRARRFIASLLDGRWPQSPPAGSVPPPSATPK